VEFIFATLTQPFVTFYTEYNRKDNTLNKDFKTTLNGERSYILCSE